MGGIDWDFRIGSLGIAAMYRLLYLKSITNNDLVFSKGNSFQYSVCPTWEKNLKNSGFMYLYYRFGLLNTLN